MGIVELLTNAEYIEQEEFREYFLDEAQFCIIDEYLRRFAESEGLAAKIGDSSYYISQIVYGKAVVVCLEEEEDGGTLQAIGDSRALGKMKADIENNLEEVLMRKTYLKTRKSIKATNGIENMNFH